MALSKYHKAWLEDHPHRTAEWLRQMLADGFEVHHIDGDHSNNHPKNLALIEIQDHRALHGIFRLTPRAMMKYMRPRKVPFYKEPFSWQQNRARLGGLAYRKNTPPRIRRANARRAAQARWAKRNGAAEVGTL